MSGGWLREWIGALVSRPLIYDLVQNLAGQARVAARLKASVGALEPGKRLLDVGSADGGFASRLDIDPVFVDLDPRPLAALRRHRSGSRAAAADAAEMPFRDRAFDVSLCVAVSHHLDDRQFERVIAELSRVTSRDLVFLDAVRNHRRPLSRWLWRFDRGRHPRTMEELRSALECRFRLRKAQQFTIYHQYVLWVASPL